MKNRIVNEIPGVRDNTVNISEIGCNNLPSDTVKGGSIGDLRRYFGEKGKNISTGTTGTTGFGIGKKSTPEFEVEVTPMPSIGRQTEGGGRKITLGWARTK